MTNNPLPNEPTEVLEDLQLKPAPQTSTPQTPSQPYPVLASGSGGPANIGGVPPADIESELQNREDALTIRFAIGKLNDYLQWFLMVLEAILIIRFVLKMFGADPGNIFASFIFTLTQVLLLPFAGIIPPLSLRENQAFEFSTLFAIAIYYLIFFALKRFLRILISNPGEVSE